MDERRLKIGNIYWYSGRVTPVLVRYHHRDEKYFYFDSEDGMRTFLTIDRVNRYIQIA